VRAQALEGSVLVFSTLKITFVTFACKEWIIKQKKKALTVKIIEIGNFEAVNHEYYIDIDPMQKWLPLYYSFVLI